MMASVKPPRSVFVDFPLGRPCGRPHDIEMQHAIIADALQHLANASQPGQIADLPYEWGTPFSWDDFMRDIEAMIKEEGESVQKWKPKT